ncbi:hypothetical protein ES703_34897 [subsurface metagenome]
MVIENKIKIFLGLLAIFLIGSLCYFFVIPAYQAYEKEKARQEAESNLQEWLDTSLQPEFLPSKLDVTLGVDIEGGAHQDQNIYGYNWDYQEKNFYSAIDYNNKKSGINAYILVVYWYEKIDLNEKSAQNILENYFNLLGKPELICGKKEHQGGIIDYCQGTWIDEEKNWHNISAVSQREEKTNRTVFIHYLTPLGSENYGEM